LVDYCGYKNGSSCTIGIESALQIVLGLKPKTYGIKVEKKEKNKGGF